jgi:hypothetical protein
MKINSFKNCTNLPLTRSVLASALLLAGLSLMSSSVSAMDDTGDRRLFVISAVENTVDDTVKLPLYRGISQGQTVWYVILDASTGDAAKKYRVNRADKLNNAKYGSGAKSPLG